MLGLVDLPGTSSSSSAPLDETIDFELIEEMIGNLGDAIIELAASKENVIAFKTVSEHTKLTLCRN